MEMTARAKITGFKFWDKPADDGKAIDSGTVFIESELKGGNAKGYSGQSYKCASAEIVKKIHHLTPPIVADVVLESQTDGKGNTSQMIMEIRPVAVEAGPVGADRKKAA